MRNCPECETAMVPTKKTFAEIDVCPNCGGTFLEAGEGAAAYGPEAEMRFLLDDGRAHRIGHSRRKCPSGHGAMTSFGVKTSAEKAVEIDFCEQCGGFFFDAGEGEALAAIEVAPPGTFVMPPPLSNQEEVIRDTRQAGPSFLARFVTSFVGRRER